MHREWAESSVSVFCGVVLWRHHQAPTLPGASVHGLDYVYHFLLVFHGPVDLVVVPSTQVNHDVLVPAKRKTGGSMLTRILLKKSSMKKAFLFCTFTNSR